MSSFGLIEKIYSCLVLIIQTSKQVQLQQGFGHIVKKKRMMPFHDLWHVTGRRRAESSRPNENAIHYYRYIPCKLYL